MKLQQILFAEKKLEDFNNQVIPQILLLSDYNPRHFQKISPAKKLDLISAADTAKELAKPNVQILLPNFFNDFIVVLKSIA